MQPSFTINPSCFRLFVRPKPNAQGKQSAKPDSDDELKQHDDQFHPNVQNQFLMKNRSITICSNTSTLPETLSTSFHNQELNQSGLEQNKEDIFYKTMPTSFQQFQFKNKRRYEPQAQITQYQIKLDSIPGDERTTLMIRNIPNKYTQPMLLENFDINHKDNYDFFYLPIDFTNKCNVGYAFINFLDSKFIPKFFLEFQGRKWKLFNSDKICEITYARIQGVEQLQGHFQYSTIMQEKDNRLKPIFKKYQSDQQFKRK
ncbi:unnamed protein product (macronuclear) [Paramecium tetraurelia]|uniref:Mei2-like C-terminal RNA recognition motif domain-containing protein n=1 Tax=Paramecium tetraurelia TaxID=5888 RepID=A0DE38_PARTE|nr:uncharacterized protein GSPATT00016147001 [Paramecium tetraurelia]CAK81305.1 unnamed protein product [Paramecium tetraurelia]|eukprot:XP_001448702.1 hypothetical protein (macronuclear) [Paramecium tetraurelia strain d4-2]